MKKHSELGKELFLSGYNCSQAVIGAFCEELGLSFETAMKLSSSFGGGMGRLREVCGAVSGAFMVLGLKYGDFDCKNHADKSKHYERIQRFAERYKELNGSIICRELLGLNEKGASVPAPEVRTEKYYKKRPCVNLVEMSCELLDEFLGEE